MKIDVCIWPIVFILLLITCFSSSKALDSLLKHRTKRAIIWNGYWAFACDFTGHDISNVLTPAEGCAGQCARTADCTHFSWTKYNGGTCWMKNGRVSQADAFSVVDVTSLCGVIVSSTTASNIAGGTTRYFSDTFQLVSCLCIAQLYFLMCSYI